ncbi:MAG: hypothetical protein RR810_03035 [Clostridia bacterium]
MANANLKKYFKYIENNLEQIDNLDTQIMTKQQIAEKYIKNNIKDIEKNIATKALTYVYLASYLAGETCTYVQDVYSAYLTILEGKIDSFLDINDQKIITNIVRTNKKALDILLETFVDKVNIAELDTIILNTGEEAYINEIIEENKKFYVEISYISDEENSEYTEGEEYEIDISSIVYVIDYNRYMDLEKIKSDLAGRIKNREKIILEQETAGYKVYSERDSIDKKYLEDILSFYSDNKNNNEIYKIKYTNIFEKYKIRLPANYDNMKKKIEYSKEIEKAIKYILMLAKSSKELEKQYLTNVYIENIDFAADKITCIFIQNAKTEKEKNKMLKIGKELVDMGNKTLMKLGYMCIVSSKDKASIVKYSRVMLCLQEYNTVLECGMFTTEYIDQIMFAIKVMPYEKKIEIVNIYIRYLDANIFLKLYNEIDFSKELDFSICNTLLESYSLLAVLEENKELNSKIGTVVRYAIMYGGYKVLTAKYKKDTKAIIAQYIKNLDKNNLTVNSILNLSEMRKFLESMDDLFVAESIKKILNKEDVKQIVLKNIDKENVIYAQIKELGIKVLEEKDIFQIYKKDKYNLEYIIYVNEKYGLEIFYKCLDILIQELPIEKTDIYLKDKHIERYVNPKKAYVYDIIEYCINKQIILKNEIIIYSLNSSYIKLRNKIIEYLKNVNTKENQRLLQYVYDNCEDSIMKNEIEK